VVVGAGPNGLTAAITLAAAGLDVRVFEAAPRAGGGARTAELTLPGFRHDVCSAVHPLGFGSPALRALPLPRSGLRWVPPELALAHPFPDGSAAVLARDVAETAESLLGGDARAYARLVGPFTGRWDAVAGDVLRSPLSGPPRHPLLAARFGARAAWPVAALAHRFRGERARALLAGLAAHSIAPTSAAAGGGVALLFAVAAHAHGWPYPRGGSQAITDALTGHLTVLGGTIQTATPITSLADLPPARAYLFDTSPHALAALAGDRLPARDAARLHRYRYGPAAFKIDYALAGPVPWTAPECRRAGTVHLGPSYHEISTALAAVHDGRAPDPPFLIVAQPTIADPSRAPEGRHVLWVYGHVPNGWPGDLTDAIERQLERFAPGFRDLVLARQVTTPSDLQTRNANYVGGDIACGSFAGMQGLLRFAGVRLSYRTANPALYLCSAATSPGPGVHGMCGLLAARSALRRTFGQR
jgi:phytoene dehydrogenase-like protein